MITVQKLISELRKLPPRAKVCWADHDQDYERGEFNSGVTSAEVAPDALKARGYGVVLL